MTAARALPDRRCRRCGAASGLRMLPLGPLTLAGPQWECTDGCPPAALDLDVIEARAAAATEGPWEHGGNDGLVWPERIGDPVSGSNEMADADFIAAARTDVPALAAEVRRLRADHAADVESLNDDLSAVRTERDALAAKVDAFVPVAFPSGEQLYAHRCNNVEWWHEPTQGPVNEQGCDACESGPAPDGWRPVYVRAEATR